MQTEIWGADVSVDMANAPPMFHLPFVLDADIQVDNNANGVIFAAGSAFGGWSFYLVDGYPVATASVSPLPGGATRLAAKEPLSAGTHSLRYEFMPSGTGGTLTLSVDGATLMSGSIKDRPLMMAGNGESLDSGRDTNDPVTQEYQHEGYFTGVINKITLRTLMPAQH
jgi:arylsulfatase